MVSVCVLATHPLHCSGAPEANVVTLARELSRRFQRVVASTTSAAYAAQLAAAVPGLETHVSQNDSYDVGLFYKAWTAIAAADRDVVTRLGFVNDSNILLCSLEEVFEWAEANGADFWGLTDNSEIQYHIQSPFLVFEKRAIPALEAMFVECGVADRWSKIGDIALLRDTVIKDFEVKLTTHMVRHGMRVAVYTPCVAAGMHWNATIRNARTLIAIGHPMIKRQVHEARYLVQSLDRETENLLSPAVSRARAFLPNA
jgi:hypothetical protein